MSQKVVITQTDDINGSEGATNVDFAFNGTTYEIDLSEDNAAKLRSVLAPYIKAGRTIKSATVRKPRTNTGAARKPRNKYTRARTKEIRSWAISEGYTVKLRGRVPEDIVVEYEKTHASEGE